MPDDLSSHRHDRGRRTDGRTSDRASASIAPSATDREKPLRTSVWPVANQTFTPAGIGIIADPAHNRECGQAPPCQCRYPHGDADSGPAQSSHRYASGRVAVRSAFPWRWAGLPSRHDHGHQRARRLEPRLFDLAKLFAPPKELADVDGGRTGNLGQNRTGLKAGCDEPLFVLARPAPTALYGRDDLNWTLGHRTTPSVCTRTPDVRINLARRPSPWAYGPLWQTRHIQYRPGIAVHLDGLHRRA